MPEARACGALPRAVRKGGLARGELEIGKGRRVFVSRQIDFFFQGDVLYALVASPPNQPFIHTQLNISFLIFFFFNTIIIGAREVHAAPLAVGNRESDDGGHRPECVHCA